MCIVDSNLINYIESGTTVPFCSIIYVITKHHYKGLVETRKMICYLIIKYGST